MRCGRDFICVRLTLIEDISRHKISMLIYQNYNMFIASFLVRSIGIELVINDPNRCTVVVSFLVQPMGSGPITKVA